MSVTDIENDDAVILGAVIATGVVTMVADATKRKSLPTIRPLIGVFVLGAMLLLISMASSEAAKGLAVLVLVTSLIVNGGAVFKTIGGLTK